MSPPRDALVWADGQWEVDSMHPNCDFPVRFKTIAVMTCALLGLSVMPISDFLAPQRASGQVLVVDHRPHHTGGPGADTLFVSPTSGLTTWQLMGENFTLTEDTFLSRVEWWGCYGGFQQNHQPPVGDETMRVRFYDSRPGDALPGNIMYEESFLNPSRTATGSIVGSCGPEFFYQADFSSLVSVQAGNQIWLEVVQVGILNSTFRWEYSLANDSMHAVVNRNLPDWTAEPGNGGLAMRLWAIPEPSGLLILVWMSLLALAQRRRFLSRWAMGS